MGSDDRVSMRASEVGMTVYGPDGEAIGTVQAVYPAVADPYGNPLSDAEMTGQPVEWAKGESWAESLARLAELPEGEAFPRERPACSCRAASSAWKEPISPAATASSAAIRWTKSAATACT